MLTSCLLKQTISLAWIKGWSLQEDIYLRFLLTHCLHRRNVPGFVSPRLYDCILQPPPGGAFVTSANQPYPVTVDIGHSSLPVIDTSLMVLSIAILPPPPLPEQIIGSSALLGAIRREPAFRVTRSSDNGHPSSFCYATQTNILMTAGGVISVSPNNN